MRTRNILAGALCVASAAFVQNSNAQIGEVAEQWTEQVGSVES